MATKVIEDGYEPSQGEQLNHSNKFALRGRTRQKGIPILPYFIYVYGKTENIFP